MANDNSVKGFRLRYLIGLSAIALLVTASFLTMQHIVSAQRGFASLINLAGHQSGLATRIAFFASVMATTEDANEFDIARQQVGRTIHKMEKAHRILTGGSDELDIPRVSNDNLKTIFDDPMVGLSRAVERFLERAWRVYDEPMDSLSPDSISYVFLVTYGPHVLEPMFDAAVAEFEQIARDSIQRIERLELIIWLSALGMLLLEVALIFRPLEQRIGQAMACLREERNFLQRVMDGVEDPVLVFDPRFRLLRMNHAARELARSRGIDLYEGQGANLLATGSDGQREHRQALMEQVLAQAEPRRTVLTLDADAVPACVFEIAISPLLDEHNQVAGTIEVFSDISQHQRLLDELQASQTSYAHLAQHDALTGLPNRVLFGDRLASAIHHAHRQRQKLGLLFIDLDGFKLINDSFDHSVGDLVLKEVAERLKRLMREDDTVARMGGDEFIIILNGIHRSQDAALVARKVLDVLKQSFHVQGQEVFIGASIGISIYPKHAEGADDLVRMADAAMYRAKEEGKNTFRYYTQGMTDKAFRRITLESRLRAALQEGQFELHYQPQYDLQSLQLTGMEALVRWQHPDKGLIAPSEFIPVAEESKLIVPLGEWILHEATQRMQDLLQRRLLEPEVIMCVNLSAKQFEQNSLTGLVQGALHQSGLTPANLELEITESTMMQSPKLTGKLLDEIRALGVKVAIDDFGTGYSSLSLLNQLPLTKLKIDQSFVRGLPDDNSQVAIALAIIRLGQSLGLETLAEGIETREQLDFLKQAGCDSAQGYLLSRPLDVATLEQALADTHTAQQRLRLVS